MLAVHRILVTGATGFVGSHLLPCLAAAFPQADIMPSTFDMQDEPAMRAALQAAPPDACVHLAAISAIPQAQADPDAAWQVNLHGTLRLARAILEESPGCTMLYVSSADAYGRSFQGGTAVTESTPLAPINTYGATKAAADLALGAMVGEGLQIIRARPFNHTGPRQSAAFVVAAFARQVARIAARIQPPILHVGALDPQRDFLDVRDICRAYALCLDPRRHIPPGTILNLASGTNRRIGDVLAELIKIGRIDAEIRTDQARLRSVDIPLACGDATAARNVLDWEPRVNWNTTLEDTFQDWRHRVRDETT